MRWIPPVDARDQLVLFAQKVDDALPSDHVVREFAVMMDGLDWSHWEAEYAQFGPGRPAVHPKVMASVILYGMLTRIRASRQLEEALVIRLDFKWLAEGRQIDHSTICNFRKGNSKRLKTMFVRLGYIALAEDILQLAELAFDGTKIRASNSRGRKLKTDDIQELHDELERKFTEQLAEAEKLDAPSDDNSKDDPKSGTPSQKLEDIRARLQDAKRALDAIEQLKDEGKPVPNNLPLTDMESRITPTKEGGFAPNYTPGVMVDTQSGLIVAADVIADTNEKTMLPGALEVVQEEFSAKPERILADGIFSSGPNLAMLEAAGIELYSPTNFDENNPALRDDPTEPVPTEQVEQLPRKKTRGRLHFSKAAFLYDAEQDVYHCPAGKRLEYKSTSKSQVVDGTEVKTRRYHSNRRDCQACPLRSACIAGEAKYRYLQRDQFEKLREQLHERMQTREGKATYARRMGPGERPFAWIKHLMGVRQFLTRGLANVQQEWLWLVTAHNIKRLLGIRRSRAGPQDTQGAVPCPCPP